VKIKLVINSKKGSATLLENHFDLVKNLIEKYPNALWRKLKKKSGQEVYELDVR